MKKTYHIKIHGSIEGAERAIKLLDRTFRAHYNVYGVRRARSRFDPVVDTLFIDVMMSADWINSPRLLSLFPEYSPMSIYDAWIRAMRREGLLNDVEVTDPETMCYYWGE